MKLQWNDGSSLADGMGTEWKPEIPEWSWSGMGMHILRALLLIILGYTTKAVNLQVRLN